MKKVSRVLKNPWLIMKFLANRGVLNWLSDKVYLKIMVRATTGKKLHLNNPQTFNEKLQWLKLYDRNPLYTIMVDKVKAKEYVAKKIGEQYIIPTLGVWKSADDIDFDSLPDRFVIKCNHNSGKGMYICRDKSRMNVNEVRKGLSEGLREDYYKHGREWPYRDVPRRILAEQYMESEKPSFVNSDVEEKVSRVGDLRDYKFYCFNGEPKLCQVISDRAVDEKIDFYDMNWNRIVGLVGLVGLTDGVHNSNQDMPCPYSFKDMLHCARILSKDIPFSRIDFYDINGRAYWGEITFFPASGFGVFRPDEWNNKIGEWLFIKRNV